MNRYRAWGIFAAFCSALCLVAIVIHIISLDHKYKADVVWPLFAIGFVLVLPTAFWLIPKFLNGTIKHIVRAIIIAVFLGPILGPPEGQWIPAYPTLLVCPSFFGLHGAGIQYVLGAYLLLIGAICASSAYDLIRLSNKRLQSTAHYVRRA